MRRKLGLQQADKRDDESLIADLFVALQDQKTDFTLFFRNLSEVSNTHGEPSRLHSNKPSKTVFRPPSPAGSDATANACAPKTAIPPNAQYA